MGLNSKKSDDVGVGCKKPKAKEEANSEDEVGEDYEESGEKEVNEWQRPTRSTKPPRFRDKEFEMQFRSEERRKRCNKLGRRVQARSCVDNSYNFHKPRKKKEECNSCLLYTSDAADE